MPVVKRRFIHRGMLQEHPDWLFLFGDNCTRTGYGGQAREMRDEPNACGVCTKVKPANSKDAFFSDSHLLVQMHWINSDLNQAFAKVLKGGTIVIPEEGLGTGRAGLRHKAPLTFQYLQMQLWALERIGKEHDGVTHLRRPNS